MYILFFLLFLISLLTLLVGIIYPNIINRKVKKELTRKQIAIRFTIITLILFILSLATAPSGTQNSSSSSSSNTTVQATTAPSDIDKFPAVKDLLSGPNNDTPSQPKLRSFEYNSDTGMVNVDFNMNQNFTTSLTRDGLKQEMSQIYIAIYHRSKVPVNNVALHAYGPVTDQYGNTSYAMLIGTKLSKDVADKINWNEDESTLELQTIPGLWTTFLGNSSLGWPESSN